jgi:predicted transcriptional regulator
MPARLASLLLVLLACALAPEGRAQDAPAACTPVEASLPSMEGHRTLSDERGRRAIVLFYEDRDHVYDNDALKIEVARYVLDNHLEGRVVTYGVANLADAGPVPELFVRELIRPALERWGSDILLDWDGVMRRAPFSFATAAANVGVIDRSGCLVYRHTGALDEAERRVFYRALRQTLR